MDHPVPTLNRCGFQMGSPSPLLQTWLDSYDGIHPLLDIGCAYGINTVKAVQKGIPVVALDPEEDHLKILCQKLETKSSDLVTCIVGSLPHSIFFPDNTFSGILCSEVLHFLDGKDIEESINIMYEKLVPRGKLVMTSLSTNYLKYTYPEKESEFYQKFEAGVKWPGLVKCDCDFLKRIRSITLSRYMHEHMWDVCPEFLHFLSKNQISNELQRCGFIVQNIDVGDHPGHPDVEGTNICPGQTLQIVAEKQ